MSGAARYRPDIDGLRAIAIVPVVLFHLDVAWCGGGFVGVDIFFVVSGFLITAQIFPEMKVGGFSFISFYERRIRRLFPAQMAMLLVTTVAAVCLLLPADLIDYAKGMAATSLFLANIWLWKTSGYFGAPSETKPLLHNWSLSVEEQFYAVFPVLLLFALRLLPRRAPILVAVAGVVSFAASSYIVHYAPDTAFYQPLFRAWEFLVGATLALGLLPTAVSRPAREVLGAAGLLLIAYATLAYSKATVFPGASALAPSLGAALVIYSGMHGPSRVNRLLCLRLLVVTGLISYSLYLWHWPLIVFAKYYLVRDLDTVEKLGVFAGAVILALISWRYVERPFRGHGRLLGRRVIYAAALAGMAGFVGLAFFLVRAQGLPGRLPDDIVQIARTRAASQAARTSCGSWTGAGAHALSCPMGIKEAAGPSFLLWGDSHALVISPALDPLAQASSRGGLFLGKAGCAPLLGTERHDAMATQHCAAVNAAIADYLDRTPSIRTVVLAARWAHMANGSPYGDIVESPALISPFGIDGNPAEFRAGFERTLHFLRERRIDIVVMTQVPEVGWEVPSVLARARWFGQARPDGPGREDYIERQRIVNETLRELSRHYRFRVVDVSRILCPAATCIVEADGKPLYLDDDHLSLEGAAYVAKALRDVL